jgi:hypothetical protein
LTVHSKGKNERCHLPPSPVAIILLPSVSLKIIALKRDGVVDWPFSQDSAPPW